jgi:glyoxylase-like metal-dependent hydrolase (beta-lactamase superfamily II)
MIHEVLPVGVLQCNCSIFGDEDTREAIVIDPGDDINDIQAILTRHRLKVKAIMITHAHIDHIGGAAKLKSATGAPVYMNQNDQELYDDLDMQAGWLGMPAPERTPVDTSVKEGDSLRLGAADFHVLDTPGHTQGSISLWIPAENKLIAGDTLFRDSIGRTDLPGGDYRQILSSIHAKLMVLPEDAVVVCGHGPTTTIGREKKFNPFVNGYSGWGRL